ncbi:MAG: hypothetical protein JKX83_01335 [Pseudomonadales bacterium]|nr:hypothetical protein [Pseudomonadales bacterium]
MKISTSNQLVLATLLGAVTAFAQASIWKPRMDTAVWQVSSSIFECRLEQPIPDFGRAVFDARAGETPRFYLDPEKNLMAPGKASIKIETPMWKRGNYQRDLGFVAVTRAKYRGYPVILDEKMSEKLLSELASGNAPLFTRSSNFSNQRKFRLVCSR